MNPIKNSFVGNLFMSKEVKFEKKINKRTVGLILGSAVLGLGGLSSTKKGKSFRRRVWDRIRRGAGYGAQGYRRALDTIKRILGRS